MDKALPGLKEKEPGWTKSLPLTSCVTTEKLLNLYGHLLNREFGQ